VSLRHIAIAVGILKEPSRIEIFDTHKGARSDNLAGHRDMVDSMMKIQFTPSKVKLGNLYINYFISAGRDRQILLWKLYDGKAMHRVK